MSAIPRPTGDLTSRMAAFARMFANQAHFPDARNVPSAADLVALVRLQAPRSLAPGDSAPVFEAAAYVGEWLAARCEAQWVAEGPFEPHLQVTDETGAILLLLPLVQTLRTATTAGYDGLAALLDDIVLDASRPAEGGPIESIRVKPDDDRAKVAAWVWAHRDVQDRSFASLWRRCATCASETQDTVVLPAPVATWETEAGVAASVLASRPFECECGGAPGGTSRLLMLRAADGARRLGDIYVTPTHTRVACWTVTDDRVEPFDARILAREEASARAQV